MKDSIFQVVKQPCITHYRWHRDPSRASLYASHLISSIVPLLIHCSTMLDRVVCIPNGYMHTGRSRTRGKTTNKRLALDLETSLLSDYTASHQKFLSQEVAS